jgi:hypothetical protein
MMQTCCYGAVANGTERYTGDNVQYVSPAQGSAGPACQVQPREAEYRKGRPVLH